jgi:hypothetical protein
MYQKVNDLDSIKKLEAEAEESRVKRNSLLQEKKDLLLAKAASLKSSLEEPPSEQEIPLFEEFTKDSTWWRDLQAHVKAKMSAKKASSAGEAGEEEQKNELAMTKLLHTTSNDFDAE